MSNSHLFEWLFKKNDVLADSGSDLELEALPPERGRFKRRAPGFRHPRRSAPTSDTISPWCAAPSQAPHVRLDAPSIAQRRDSGPRRAFTSSPSLAHRRPQAGNGCQCCRNLASRSFRPRPNGDNYRMY